MIIYGASGHGKVVCDILLKNNPLVDIVFIDDAKKNNVFYNYPVYLVKDYPVEQQPMIIAIGNNLTRKKIASRYHNYANAIDPSAVLSKSVRIGIGNTIMPNACCNADTQIGSHVIINTASSIDHDCKIDDFAHISPNASLAGNVKVGMGSHIGIGASIIQGIKIGKFATVGAGAVVIEDVPDYATVVGVPAKIIKIEK